MSQDIVTLKVTEVCGSHCIGVEDGAFLFERIRPLLQSGGKVCLDFTGVLTPTSSFLNASIGKLFGQFDHNDLEERLQWTGLDESDVQLIQLVIRNAKEHFTKSQDIRQVEENIIQQVLTANNMVSDAYQAGRNS